MSKISKEIRLAKLPYHIMLGLSATAVGSSPVFAQTEQDDSNDESGEEVVLEEVIVTGMRNSLLSSQNIKRTSDVIVDAVTAEDIGALPDRSVAEVLQRVPGVTISRFDGANDPDHFSVEGSGTVVRGLNFVRSELNGRSIFTADSGQALGFNSVSPELMGSVQVFKNQSAYIVECGIGGTVNLITRKPMDQKGQLFAYSLEANYGDLREEWTPGVSALYSNNWDLSGGSEIGFLVSAAYNELKTRSDGTLVAEWLGPDLFPGRRPTLSSGQYAPTGAGIRTQEFDRERSGISAAVQWRSADGRHEVTAEFFRSTFDNSWGEYVIEPGADGEVPLSPAPGTSFTFDNNNLFESGVLSEAIGWRGNDPRHGYLAGSRQVLQRRMQENESTTSDVSVNYKWAINDQWSTNFDLQFSQSEVDVYDISTQSAIMGDVSLDLSGSLPRVGFETPEGGTGTGEEYWANPYNHWIRSIMDHEQDNEGDLTAFRADAEYDFEGSDWAKSVRFGARVTERDQTVLRSTYNWGNVSATWNDTFFLDDPSLPADLYPLHCFDNYQRGKTPICVPIYNGSMKQEDLKNLTALAGNGGWTPVYERGGVVPGTSFLPGETNETTQDTMAFYAKFDFGFEFDNGMFLDGNIGVRFVETDVTAVGGVVYPDYETWLSGSTIEERCDPNQEGSIPGFCALTPAEQASYAAWADGSSEIITDTYNYDNTLPSLNLRWGLNEDMFIRFAYSKAISRPDFGLLKSNFPINFGGDDANGDWLGPDTNSAQVRIDPIEADQFDLSWEWYFADVGSVTVTGFYKDLDNYIVPGSLSRDFTNNGETWDVFVEGTTNTPDGGKIKGVELSYQQVFDMLPGWMSGFGVQANYTYIDTDGVPNVGPDNVSPDGQPESADNQRQFFDVTPLGLPGLSEDTANLIVFWESDKISTRLAYNYRSEYTLTTRDVIYPYTPIIHGDTGQLDFSFFYTFNPAFKLGLQAVNLTDEITETRSIYNNDLDQGARSYFMNDRRYSIILRGQF